MIWLFDPLHRFSRPMRFWCYLYATVYFGRLAVWYGIENRCGRP